MNLSIRFGLGRHLGCYAATVVIVAAAFLLRVFLVREFGPGVPLYITLYPAVIGSAILFGRAPGLMAIALVLLGVDYWFLLPAGRFSITRPSDAAGFLLFGVMNVLIIQLTESLRVNRQLNACLEEYRARKQAKEDLHKSSEWKQIALDAAELGVWEFRLGSEELTWDAVSRRIFGFLPDEPILYSALVSRVHPDDRQQTNESFQKAISSPDGNNWRHEYRIVRPDGAMRWVVSCGRAYFTAEGAQQHADRILGVTMDITRHKLAEQSLAESHTKLETAIASSSDAVLISDIQGRITHFNDAVVSHLRFKNKSDCPLSVEEFPSIFEAFTPDGEFVPFERWATPRALKGEVVTNAEYRMRRKDSGESWVANYSFSPIRDSAGSIIGSVVVGRDITEQKRQQEELENYRRHLEDRVAQQTQELLSSEKRYRSLFENLPIGTLVQTADGEIIEANQAACQILRLTMDQLCARTSIDPSWKAVRADGSPFPGEEHPAMVAFATGKTVLNIVMGLGGDEDRSWISINSHPLFNGDAHRPHAVITTFIDITRRVRDQVTISALNRQMTDLFSSATEQGIVATDLNGRITLFNRGAELLFGYSADELLGRERPSILHPPGNLENIATDLRSDIKASQDGFDAILAFIRREGKLELETKYRRKDGTTFDGRANITPITSSDGKITGYVAVVSDITSRVRIVEQLKLLASTDYLTGLSNRRVFEEALQGEFHRVQRYKSPSAIILLDIDLFKRINDNYGHQAGDRALVEMAQALKKIARSTDIAARLGGDEFVVLVTGTDLAGALVVAGHIRNEVANLTLNTRDHSLNLTVSIGISPIDVADDHWSDALERADTALYSAKQQGRNRIVVNDPETPMKSKKESLPEGVADV